MRIVFTGHRDQRANDEDILLVLRTFPNATIIHGGARGFDMQVDRLARSLDRRPEIHRPNYEAFGRGAPLVRNVGMLKAGCDLVVALYDGRRTGGTFQCMQEALGRGIPVHWLACVKEKVKT